MSLSELSVRRPVLMTMVYVLICAVACIFLPKLDVALYPSVSNPVISVSVSCGDSGPEEIEMQVAKLLETRLGSIEGLEKITTTSSSGSCRAVLTFSYSTDLDNAANDVNAQLSRITRALPSWAEAPIMTRYDSSSSSTTVLNLRITGPYSLEDLKTMAEDTVVNLIERIDGVEDVTVSGRDNTRYTVMLDPISLASLNLTLNQVATALGAGNIQGTGGSFEQGTLNNTVVLDSRFTTLQDIRETVITVRDGVAIKVGDVAKVETTTRKTGNVSYLNGESVVSLSVTNASDSNASTVAKRVKAELDNVNAALPAGVEVFVTRDNTAMITSTMNEVYKNAIEGVILAAIIIFIFLRGIKTTFIISLSMPISILITLMVMSIAKVSVNTMSMSGLILGIGMIVDASICILENSYFYREQGYKSVASAILGSKNMITAIMASTLTTICVFLPVLIYRTDLGMMGMMFTDLIITICISLLSSLFVAVTLVPALFGSILKVNSRTQKPLRFFLFRALDRLCIKIEKWMENFYAAVLKQCLKNRFLFVLLLVLLLVFSLGFFSNIGLSLAPQNNTDDSVSMTLNMAPGTIRDVTLNELFRVETELEKVLPREAYESISIRTSGTSSGRFEVSLPDITNQSVSASQVKKMLAPIIAANPAATWTFGGGRGFGGSAIRVEILSSSVDDAKAAADDISSIIATYVPQAENITTDLANGAPQVRVVIDRDIASSLGVTPSAVLSLLRSAMTGTESTSLNTFSSTTTYVLYVEYEEGSVMSIDDLGALLINTNNGLVSLESFVSFEKGTSAKSIQRENKVRVNRVNASAKEGVSASVIQAEVDKALAEHFIAPEGVTIRQRGEMADFASYVPTLTAIIIIALILVYAVMAAQFESLTDPFIIFTTIPMLLIGVAFIHVIMGQDFSLFSIVGIVALIGVVVNNGIVLVDAINREVAQKKPIMESCIAVAKRRLRPILMTTLTTIIGMIPMAFFPGEGAAMMQPIALTFVGGMVTGSFMTLFLTPVLYSVFNKRKEKHFNDPDSLANQLAEFDKMKI